MKSVLKLAKKSLPIVVGAAGAFVAWKLLDEHVLSHMRKA